MRLGKTPVVLNLNEDCQDKQYILLKNKTNKKKTFHCPWKAQEMVTNSKL